MKGLYMDIETLLKKINSKDIELTKSRFVDDYDFYAESVKELLNDSNWESLGTYLDQNKVKESFDTAHLLKGVAGNCGLTELYNLLVQIVEPLRNGSMDFEELKETYHHILVRKEEIQEILIS